MAAYGLHVSRLRHANLLLMLLLTPMVVPVILTFWRKPSVEPATPINHPVLLAMGIPAP
jgi:hypothetical protein